MSDVAWRDWVEWRLNVDPRPTGTVAQRRLGAAQVLFDMLLKVTPPEKSDVIATLVETSAAQGQPYAKAHMWLMNVWALDMQRQMNGEPRSLGCGDVDDSEAVYLTEQAIGLLGMYAISADPGAVDGLSGVLARQILLQPRLAGLSTEEINSKLAIRDAYLEQGIEAYKLSLDMLGILTEVKARADAAKPAVSNKAPAPAPKKKWWQA